MIQYNRRHLGGIKTPKAPRKETYSFDENGKQNQDEINNPLCEFQWGQQNNLDLWKEVINTNIDTSSYFFKFNIRHSFLTAPPMCWWLQF
ncbi:hypothetical protein HZS_2931 [Henneguya salminicola]|nr:hypothetical protein HZS_2931 [Henneguya salminicola]